MVRKWEHIESKNRLYCNGRCITGHNIGVFILALVLINVVSGLFFAFDCPYLAQRLSPVIPVFAAIQFLCVLCFIFRTACSDPGILPRGTPDEIQYLERKHSTKGQNVASLATQAVEVHMQTGHTLKLKYCSTCKIFRPPRVSHCSLCDACIANFDHHCPWVGNCVGLRNYRYFYLFLLSLSIFCIYIFTFNVTNLVLRTQDKSFIDAMRDTPASVIEIIICFFSIWSISGLWGYHTYLICRSTTTNEDIKGTWKIRRSGDAATTNPFSKGNSCLNCFSTLCSPLPPSFLNLRAVISSNDKIHTTENEMHRVDNVTEITPSQQKQTNRSDNHRHKINHHNGIQVTVEHPRSNQKQHRTQPRDYI